MVEYDSTYEFMTVMEDLFGTLPTSASIDTKCIEAFRKDYHLSYLIFERIGEEKFLPWYMPLWLPSFFRGNMSTEGCMSLVWLARKVSDILEKNTDEAETALSKPIDIINKKDNFYGFYWKNYSIKEELIIIDALEKAGCFNDDGLNQLNLYRSEIADIMGKAIVPNVLEPAYRKAVSQKIDPKSWQSDKDLKFIRKFILEKLWDLL